LHASNTPFRSSAIRLRDQDSPHDNTHPEGEHSAKRKKTSEHETYVFGESSSSQANESEPGPSTSGNQEQLDDFDFQTDTYATDDDEIPAKKPTLVVQSCQRHPKSPALSLVNQDLLYLKKGNSGPEKFVLSLHKFPAVIFPDDCIKERTSRWIVQVIKTYGELGHEQKFVTKIIARRANGSIVSIIEPDYKNLNKNDIKDMYLLCLAGYYRRFIKGFSKIAKPMTKLTQKKVKFVWGDKQEAAFQLLMQKLCSAPILALPEGSEDFIDQLLPADASPIALSPDYISDSDPEEDDEEDPEEDPADYPADGGDNDDNESSDDDNDDDDVGLFKGLERVESIANKLKLPQELSRVHNAFHVSNLKKCCSEDPLVVPLEGLHVDDKLHFVEEPVEIMNREVKQLRRSRVPIVKVRWNSRRGPEFT
ncbi:hypothetical protein Tco_0695358, partial [Tanacetum coccineum]